VPNLLHSSLTGVCVCVCVCVCVFLSVSLSVWVCVSLFLSCVFLCCGCVRSLVPINIFTEPPVASIKKDDTLLLPIGELVCVCAVRI
jgi:hypothetical protein